MARFPNGRIPKRSLVHLEGDHWLTPGTKVRWDNLVADVLKNEGVRLRISSGPNAYRDLGWQQRYWNTLPYPQASYPGASSHGGEYKGRDSMAIDVANWGMIGKDKFYAYARKHGFEPNFFDWEPWHIIDWTPWSVPAGGGSTPVPIPEPIPETEEDEMAIENVMHHKINADERMEVKVSNPFSGFELNFVTGSKDTLQAFADQYKTGNSQKVSSSVFRVIGEACAAVRPQGTLAVNLGDADE